MAQLNKEISVKTALVYDPAAYVLNEANELLRTGQKLVKAKSYELGIDQLSDALALMVDNFGELDSRNGLFYLEYGKALLTQGDILASTMSSPQQKQELTVVEKGDLEGEQSEEKDPLPGEDAMTKSVDHVNNFNPLEAKTKDDGYNKKDQILPTNSVLPNTKLKDSTDLKSNEVKANEDQTSAVKEGADSSADTRELAWQLFETARVIFVNDKNMQDRERFTQLGLVHHLLGEVALGGGSFEKGYQEFTTCIKLLGKSLQISDPKIGRAQQLAGLCAVHQQELQAAQFHYTAAAENHNMHLEEILIKEGVMEPKKPEVPESEDIEFVDRKYLEALKEKLGEQSDIYKKCSEIFGIVNDLIDRVEELMVEEEQKKQQVADVMKIIAEKMKSGEFLGCKPTKVNVPSTSNSLTSDPKVTEQTGFDVSQQPVTAKVQELGTFGGLARKVKRAAPLGIKREQEETVCKKIKTS